MLRYSVSSLQLPLGEFLLLEIDGALCALCRPETLAHSLNKVKACLQQPLTEAVEPHPIHQTAKAQFEEYFAGIRREFTLPVQLYGSKFQQQVWQQLQNIPYGKTTTYGKIAAVLGTKGTQAVGNAVGANPLPIIVPCHRVLPASGKLGNFSMYGGSASKAFLLDLEQIKYR